MEGVYPKWLYHSEKPATLVQDEAAHKALGPGWYESPAECPPPKTEPKARPPIPVEIVRAPAAPEGKPSKGKKKGSADA